MQKEALPSPAPSAPHIPASTHHKGCRMPAAARFPPSSPGSSERIAGVADLAQMPGVSLMTVRPDVECLDAEGAVEKIHGAA